MTDSRSTQYKEWEEFPQRQKRKAYLKPQLTEYENMENLTRSGKGFSADGGIARRKGP